MNKLVLPHPLALCPEAIHKDSDWIEIYRLGGYETCVSTPTVDYWDEATELFVIKVKLTTQSEPLTGPKG